MLNNYLQILENSRVVIPEKRETNEFYNHPAFFWETIFTQYLQGKKMQK